MRRVRCCGAAQTMWTDLIDAYQILTTPRNTPRSLQIGYEDFLKQMLGARHIDAESKRKT